ncbi:MULTISPECIES: nucleotide exchange factor GrpE [unclassified Streptomyces]|uniref:nucleotide exchange factor GrpE n=1 Tax=unclassified Streptomyces TaxID=2593676 RepID=UPI0010643A59|nr:MULTISPECIES: nucleotide exchange factor GrpE [unclassified Streptomyces]TDU80548.1 molecular chaperone GrpE [Streptomyces sp. KS 21]THA39919.1 nucleotide exchange factor GrpE [Streptomyces sp. A1547]
MSRPKSFDGPRRQPPVVIRDKRRIDPVTLQLRAPDTTPAQQEAQPRAGEPGTPGPPAAGSPPEAWETQLAERTADLQRLKAEYDNYRKRVRRDRLAIREIAVANVLGGLLPVLDAIDRAREHGELDPGFGAVAHALETQLATLGLQEVGAPGEVFDPAQHEAVSYQRSDEVDQPTCTTVLRPGYRVGQHLLRPAQVTVSEPPDQARPGHGNAKPPPPA